MAFETAERADPGEGRFAFGENWRSFAERLAPDRIASAEDSLAALLGRDALQDRSFLDIGSGSGLFSLAAARLGAERVHSFDYDEASVATTAAVRDRYAPEARWTVDRGDVLDAAYLSSLGEFDVVYSWGVLHHTGGLWKAIDGAAARVAAGGVLFVAIYNDQGAKSRAWARVKLGYQRVPRSLRRPYAYVAGAPLELRTFAGYLARGRGREYVREWTADQEAPERGMSRKHDLIDWIGGYPFEYARPEAVLDFCRERGFELRRLVTVGGSHGCNEFVFDRASGSASA